MQARLCLASLVVVLAFVWVSYGTPCRRDHGRTRDEAPHDAYGSGQEMGKRVYYREGKAYNRSWRVNDCTECFPISRCIQSGNSTGCICPWTWGPVSVEGPRVCGSDGRVYLNDLDFLKWCCLQRDLDRRIVSFRRCNRHPDNIEDEIRNGTKRRPPGRTTTGTRRANRGGTKTG